MATSNLLKVGHKVGKLKWISIELEPILDFFFNFCYAAIAKAGTGQSKYQPILDRVDTPELGGIKIDALAVLIVENLTPFAYRFL